MSDDATDTVVWKPGTSLPEILRPIAHVDFEPCSGCTRKCTFCDPAIRPRTRRTHPTYLDPGRVQGVCDELSEYGFSGVITLCGHGEPLMDRRIDKLVDIIKDTVPEASLMLVTNGDLITPEVLKRVARVDIIHYDQYDRRDSKLGLIRSSFVGRVVHLRCFDPRVTSQFTDRAGFVAESSEKLRKSVAHRGCFTVQLKVCMAADGTWYLCCQDASHHHHWQGSLADLAANEEYRDFRHRLGVNVLGVTDEAARPRETLFPCRQCLTWCDK